MRLLIPVLVVAATAALGGSLRAGSPSFQSELDKMATHGADYDPTPLLNGGLKGLEAVLDRLLPAAPPCPDIDDEQLMRLLRSESSDDRAKGMDWVRQAIEAGHLGYLQIAHLSFLMESDAATLRQRDEELARIVQPVLDADREISAYLPAFKKYVRVIDDRELIASITDRVVLSLGRNDIVWEAREEVLKHAVVAISRSRDKQQIRRLAACYDVKKGTDGRRAAGAIHGSRGPVWLIDLASHGKHRGLGEKGDLDALLVAGLSSNNEDVLHEAIASITSINDASLLPLTRTALFNLFRGENEGLKFHACFPLMYMFADADAVGYLIEQAASADRDRCRESVRWLGDTCNWGKTPSPELIEVLRQHATSEDVVMRRVACGALSTYAGKEVVGMLIERLDDQDAEVAEWVAFELTFTPIARRDKSAFIEVLKAAAKTSDSAVVREKCQAAVEELESE